LGREERHGPADEPMRTLRRHYDNQLGQVSTAAMQLDGFHALEGT
jgi:hypothetical protein